MAPILHPRSEGDGLWGRYAGYQDQEVAFIQQTSIDPQCYGIGDATLSATVGAASIAWPVTVAQPTQ
jgi:hypothetical protein